MNSYYTKQQIVEAIKHWKSVLKRMDESKNALLSELFATFNINDLLKPFNGRIDSKLLDDCYIILNKYLFSLKLPKLPLIYESNDKIRDFLIDRETNPNNIPNIFFGVHSVTCDNDQISNWAESLQLHDDVILLNSSHINGKSLSFLIACLCHEMIHYYDRLFGEYCDFTKYTLITGIKKDKHNTMTFETMKEEANNLGIKVIQQIPKDKDIEILDKEGIELLFKKAQAEGLVLEGENQLKTDTSEITFFKNRPGCVINTF